MPCPDLEPTLAEWGIPGRISGCGRALRAIVVTMLLCRHIRSLGWLGIVLCAGTLITVLDRDRRRVDAISMPRC